MTSEELQAIRVRVAHWWGNALRMEELKHNEDHAAVTDCLALIAEVKRLREIETRLHRIFHAAKIGLEADSLDWTAFADTNERIMADNDALRARLGEKPVCWQATATNPTLPVPPATGASPTPGDIPE